jgi:hypothetical protein
MSMIDCSGLLSNASRWRDIIRIDNEDKSLRSYVYSRHGVDHLVVAVGSLLTISTLKGDTFEETSDMEFDNAIEAVCWGLNASCLIAGDDSGTLHFVTPSGELLFSHRVLASKLFGKIK